MNHPLWKEFAEWAENHHVSLEHEDDWSEWWKCFEAGAIAGTKALVKSQFGPVEHELDNLKKVVQKVTKKAKNKQG